MNNIELAWQGYKDKIMPANAPAIQIQETRRAFYAGAFTMFNLITGCAEDITEEMYAKMLTDIQAELNKFFMQPGSNGL